MAAAERGLTPLLMCFDKSPSSIESVHANYGKTLAKALQAKRRQAAVEFPLPTLDLRPFFKQCLIQRKNHKLSYRSQPFAAEMQAVPEVLCTSTRPTNGKLPREYTDFEPSDCSSDYEESRPAGKPENLPSLISVSWSCERCGTVQAYDTFECSFCSKPHS